MKEFIGICLIGAGRAGLIHARNIAGQIPEARIVGVVDPEEETAERAAAEFGCSFATKYEEMLENKNIDAVIIASPTKYHKDTVIYAADKGRHVFCEKPMAMTTEECEEMIEACERNKVKLQIGFMRRFDEGFLKAKAIIESGQIGQIVMVKSLTHGPSTPHEWMYDIRKSNGPLAEVNSHDIDTIRWLSGSEVRSLYALAGNYRCREAQERYPDFYDTVLMNIRMENGSICCIDGAQGVQYGYDARVDVVGTKGLITIGDLRNTRTVTYTKEHGMVGDVVGSWRDLFTDAYVAEDKSFIRAIIEDRIPEVTGEDGRMAVAVVHAGNESISKGGVVELNAGRGLKLQKCGD